MKKIILILAFISLLIVIAVGTLSQKDTEPTTLMKLKEKYSKKKNLRLIIASLLFFNKNLHHRNK